MGHEVRIENLREDCKLAPAREILRKDGIALAAVGSLACVRSLYLTAKEMKKTEFLFWKALSARDYSMGKHTEALRSCVQEAVLKPGVKGVIIYASCLDILAYLDLSEITLSVENPNQIPIEVLYRGPLSQRKCPPGEALKKIWSKWNPGESVMLPEPGEEKSCPPPAPDFEGILRYLQDFDCDILLLTPGGCKSCINLGCEEGEVLRGWNTRFSDVFLCNCRAEMLEEEILRVFPKERPLILLGSAVMEMIGLDIEGICDALQKRGKQVCYLESNGFADAKTGVESAKEKLFMEIRQFTF